MRLYILYIFSLCVLQACLDERIGTGNTCFKEKKSVNSESFSYYSLGLQYGLLSGAKTSLIKLLFLPPVYLRKHQLASLLNQMQSM